MPCNPEVMRGVPLFSLPADEEMAVLAGQVELRKFVPPRRVSKRGDRGGQAYGVVSGKVRVSTVEEDQQEVVIDLPGAAGSSVLPACWCRGLLPTGDQ
jgi:CRP/FNR family cyclic AMP-dependent transcriptional regulator